MSTDQPIPLSNAVETNGQDPRMASAGVPVPDAIPARDERVLIHRAREGDSAAFRLLVERHMKRSYDVAFGFLNDHHLAEDVTQEAFVRVHRSLAMFRGEAEFSTWLYRIITNLSLNQLKKRKRRAERELNESEMPVTINESGGNDRIDMSGHIERALHELPTLQRAVVILRHLDGLSTKQVSRILRCSEGTVKTHLFRGLKKLKTKLRFLEDEG